MGTLLTGHAHEVMFGRDADLQRVQSMLRRGDRMITLRGPGGIGKTALATHVAASVRTEYDHVILVDLAAQRDPQQVPAVISAHLPMQSSHGDPLRSIVEFSRHARVLLLLDNFEQLLPAAEHLAHLLSQTSTLQLLVTSRAALQLHGEHEYPLEPLALPSAARQAHDSPAVQLLVKRAQATIPDFELTDENAAQVVRLCGALEGVPLAIELAAARLRTFSLPDLLGRLERPLGVLKADFRDRPERLRSLRAAVQWSYDLLSEEDREVFECCAVFAGSFTPDALVVVWGDEGVLDRVESLIEQSFLHRVGGPVTRWKMLQPLRELALEHLNDHPQVETWRERHARHYLNVLREMRSSHPGMHPQARELYLPDYPNMREGLTYATDRQMTEIALGYLGGIRNLWSQFSMHAEGRQLAERALVLDSRGLERERMVGLLALAGCLIRLGEPDGVEACLREHRALCQEYGNDRERTGSELVYAIFLNMVRRYDEAVEMNQRVIEWCEHLGPQQSRETANIGLRAAALQNSVEGLMALGRYEKALDHALKSHALYEQIGSIQAGTRRTVTGRALLHLDRKDEAAREYLFALRAAVHHRYFDDIADAARGLMHVAAVDHPLLAVKFNGFASVVSVHPDESYTRHFHNGQLERLRAELGGVDFQAAWREGEQLTPEEVVRLAEELVEGRQDQVELATTEGAGVSPAAPGTGHGLTAREIEVLALVVQGHPDRKIAKLLNISSRTASKHVGNMLTKLELRNRTELARWAIEHGVTA